MSNQLPKAPSAYDQVNQRSVSAAPSPPAHHSHHAHPPNIRIPRAEALTPRAPPSPPRSAVLAGGPPSPKTPFSAARGSQTLKIPKSLHGLIIGKGGGQIRDLQDEFGVRIQIPGRDDPSDNVRIEGNHRAIQQVHNRLEDLLGVSIFIQPGSDKLSETWTPMPANERQSSHVRRPNQTETFSAADIETIKVHIPAKFHHMIVGPGGSIINSLQAENEVIIRVPDREESIAMHNSEVAISGVKKNIEKALIAVEALIHFKPNSSLLIGQRLGIPWNTVGLIIGPKGATLQDLERRFNCAIMVPKKDEAPANSAEASPSPTASPANPLAKSPEFISVQSNEMKNLINLKAELEKLVKGSVEILCSSEETRIQRPKLDITTKNEICEVLFFPDENSTFVDAEEGMAMSVCEVPAKNNNNTGKNGESEANNRDSEQSKASDAGFFKNFLAKLKGTSNKDSSANSTPNPSSGATLDPPPVFLTASPSLARTKSGSFIRVSYVFERFLLYLGSATQTLSICIFTLTDDRLSNLLIELWNSGVKIRIITEAKTANDDGSDIALLMRMGIPVKKRDYGNSLFHHKFAVLDGSLLINGSFNWTRSASSGNHENVVISNKKELVQPFAAQFEKLWNNDPNTNTNNNSRMGH